MAVLKSYLPKYCELLKEHMRQGYSFLSFAAVVGVCKDTLYHWVNTIPDFKQAKKEADMLAMHHWEQKGLDMIDKESKAAALWIFNMKCRFRQHGWIDNGDMKIEHTINEAKKSVTSDEIKKMIAMDPAMPDRIKQIEKKSDDDSE